MAGTGSRTALSPDPLPAGMQMKEGGVAFPMGDFFDQAVGGLKQALASGQLIPADEARKPLVLEGTIRAAGHFGFNRFWVEMDSGDRWEIEASNRFDQIPPKRGTKVTIKRLADQIGGPSI